jgi:hypothetical protein
MIRSSRARVLGTLGQTFRRGEEGRKCLQPEARPTSVRARSFRMATSVSVASTITRLGVITSTLSIRSAFSWYSRGVAAQVDPFESTFFKLGDLI